MTNFTMTPTQTQQAIIDCMEVGLVPLVRSSPGIGKSSLVQQIAKDYNLKLIDIRLSQCTPEDLQGLPFADPNTGKSAFRPFDMFPIEGDPLPEGYDGWVIFLDELPSASRSVQAASFKLVLDRMAGQHKLHENAYIVAAGNLETDAAIVNPISTPMQSRLVHIQMELNFKEWMKWAQGKQFDPRILGFLEFQPDRLHTFKPDHSDSTFACPRTWEFANRLVAGKSENEINLSLLAGTLSDGPAVDLMNFIGVYEKLPSMAQILRDPEGIQVPTDQGTRYAMTTMLVEKYQPEEFKDVVRFVRRLPSELQVVYFRNLVARHPTVRRTPEFTSSTFHLMKFLNDDEDFSPSKGANAA